MSEVVGGILLTPAVLDTAFFQVLGLFVAFNTILYVTLAIGKMLPRIHLSRRSPGRGLGTRDDAGSRAGGS